MKTKKSNGLTAAPLFDGFYTKEAHDFSLYYAELQKSTGQLIPPRAALNPAHIKTLLPWLAIAEAESDEVWTIRLMGTGLVDRAGADLTGQNYLKVLSANHREARLQAADNLFNWPCAAVAVQQETYEQGSPILVEQVSYVFAKSVEKPSLFVAIERDFGTSFEPEGRGKRTAIKSVLAGRYLDIGAGVPDVPMVA